MNRGKLLGGTTWSVPPIDPEAEMSPEQATRVRIVNELLDHIDEADWKLDRKLEGIRKRKRKMSNHNWSKAVSSELRLGEVIKFTTAGVNQTLHIPCSHGHIEDVRIKPYLPPEIVVKNMLRDGWKVGSKLTCPTHARKPKDTTKYPRRLQPPPPPPKQDNAPKEKTMTSNVTPLKADAPVPSSTEAARLAKRAAMDWLTEAFDAEKGRYKDGVSDETIATETKLSETAVKVLREEFFGSLKEPGEIAQFRSNLDALQTSLDASYLDAKGQIEGFRRHLDRLCTKNGW